MVLDLHLRVLKVKGGGWLRRDVETLYFVIGRSNFRLFLS